MPAARSPARRKPARSVAREGARVAFRSALLEAAEAVFIRAGFRTAKMADIAAEAGVAVGTLYNYFDSKERIFSEILRETQEQFRTRLADVLEIADPLERLEGVVRAVMLQLEERGAVFALFLELGAMTELDIERVGGELAQEGYVEFLGILEDVIQACVGAKKLRRDIRVPTMVAALSGAINGILYSWLARGRRGRLSAATEEVWTLFLKGASR